MDHAHSRGTKSMCSIAVNPELRKCVEGSILFKTNEIVNTVHRYYVVDINLEEYFQEEFSGWYKIEGGILDANKRVYREKFNEFMDEALDSFPLESTVQHVNNSIVTQKERE